MHLCKPIDNINNKVIQSDTGIKHFYSLESSELT